MRKLFAGLFLTALSAVAELCPVIPFVAITGRPTEADVARKVAALKETGYDQLFIYARSGLQYAYMGEEWLALCAQFCREAELRGMKVWLYDEYNWPSGTCKGRVPAENEAWRYSEMAVYRNADGTCRWQNTLGPTGWVNVLEPDAVKRFIELTHHVYEKRLARWFANGTIKGIFTDEPGHPVGVTFDGKPVAHFRWWSSLERDYHAETGRAFRADVEAWLADRASAHASVWDVYARLMGRQFRHAYFDQIRAWCDRVGIFLTGHMISEDSVTGSCHCNGDPLHVLKGESLPGMDEISTRSATADAEWLTLNVAQHTARRNGRGALVELFALGPNDMSPAKMRQMIWLEALHNVDHYLACMEVMDARGLIEKHGYLSPIMEGQPWRARMKPLLAEASRAARFARKTDFEFEVAVRYPQRLAALATHAGGKRPKINELLREFNTRQVAFDLYQETERADQKFIFAVDAAGVVTEERSGRMFPSPRAAADFVHASVRPRFRVLEQDGSLAGDIVVRNFADGSTVVLNLLASTDRILIADVAGEKTVFQLPARGVLVLEKDARVPVYTPLNVQVLTERMFALSLDRGNVWRINFNTNKVGTLTVSTPLKGVRFALRDCAIAYAVTSSGRPVDSFEKPAPGEKIFRHEAVPYSFEMDGRLLAPAGACTVLNVDFNGLYRETAPMDLAPGVHTLRIVTGEADQNFFLPALFVTGDFAVFNGVLCPRPAFSGVGPLSSVGLDTFTGAVSYEAKVTPPSGDGLRLRLNTGGLFTSVSWNGVDLGTRAWAPFEWPIPSDQPGKLRITVYPPLANMFGDVNSPVAKWDLRFWMPPREMDYVAGLVAAPEWAFSTCHSKGNMR